MKHNVRRVELFEKNAMQSIEKSIQSIKPMNQDIVSVEQSSLEPCIKEIQNYEFGAHEEVDPSNSVTR
jgi:hypothetical protein